jgi:hypothetical protein
MIADWDVVVFTSSGWRLDLLDGSGYVKLNSVPSTLSPGGAYMQSNPAQKNIRVNGHRFVLC